jgi:hypothetical protein
MAGASFDMKDQTKTPREVGSRGVHLDGVFLEALVVTGMAFDQRGV